ncbi:MAG: NAD(P)-dependent oxidoreductase [Pyramidobacter sp.]|nr:NAD(P)-dependent oxidoreductase [Pyramidobacter sp.]
MSLKKIGFAGLGVMGRSMASNLMNAGFDLMVYNRTASSAESLLARGAQWAKSPKELASECDAVITIVGYPKDVEEVYFGANGLFEGFSAGKILIDMTTSSPLLAARIGEEAAQRGGAALDAPVSGGDVGAREARLSIMVGGSQEAFDAALPLFQAMGKQIKLQGKCGSGQYTKMANQIAIASNMMGVCEALIYAKRAGLDPRQVLSSISGGAAGSFSLSNLAPRMLDGNFAPGFYVKHFIKDMKIALESAREMNLELPGLETAYQLYQKLAAEGCENDGTQALYKLYDR